MHSCQHRFHRDLIVPIGTTFLSVFGLDFLIFCFFVFSVKAKNEIIVNSNKKKKNREKWQKMFRKATDVDSGKPVDFLDPQEPHSTAFD